MLTGLNAVMSALGEVLAPVDSQHAYGTQVVELLGEKEARSLRYFTASQFGRGKFYGEVGRLSMLEDLCEIVLGCL